MTQIDHLNSTSLPKVRLNKLKKKNIIFIVDGEIQPPIQFIAFWWVFGHIYNVMNEDFVSLTQVYSSSRLHSPRKTLMLRGEPQLPSAIRALSLAAIWAMIL